MLGSGSCSGCCSVVSFKAEQRFEPESHWAISRMCTDWKLVGASSGAARQGQVLQLCCVFFPSYRAFLVGPICWSFLFVQFIATVVFLLQTIWCVEVQGFIGFLCVKS